MALARLLLLLLLLCFHGDRAMRYRRLTLICLVLASLALCNSSSFDAARWRCKCQTVRPVLSCSLPRSLSPFRSISSTTSRSLVRSLDWSCQSIALASSGYGPTLDVTAVAERMVECENGDERSTGRMCPPGQRVPTSAILDACQSHLSPFCLHL